MLCSGRSYFNFPTKGTVIGTKKGTNCSHILNQTGKFEPDIIIMTEKEHIVDTNDSEKPELNL